jgi:uncharacterized protein YkwD
MGDTMRAGVFAALLAVAGLLLGGCPALTSEQEPQTSCGGSGSGAGTTPAASNSGSATQTAGATGASTGSTGSSANASSACQKPLQDDTWKSDVFRLVNQERAKYGAKPVAWNAALESEAAEYACEMIDDDFFAHVNPRTGATLADRAEAANYEYWMIGENLAAGQPDPPSVVTAWMNSPEHRENLLNAAFTEMGIGIRNGGDYEIYWVQELGRPQSAEPYREAQ